MAILLFIWGMISFHNLPVEAYPDVANTWVQVITQWPGRAAEEVEQQVTIPHRNPDERHPASSACAVRVVSWTLGRRSHFRRRFRQRLGPPESAGAALAGHTSTGRGRGDRPQFRPIGSVYWYTLKSTNPAYDLMDLKSLQDWVVSKYIRSVPDVVDDSSFGGVTREYQVRVDPEKLISYGLSLAQIEQQLTNANANVGGSFIEQGSQPSQRAGRWLGHRCP